MNEYHFNNRLVRTREVTPAIVTLVSLEKAVKGTRATTGEPLPQRTGEKVKWGGTADGGGDIHLPPASASSCPRELLPSAEPRSGAHTGH